MSSLLPRRGTLRTLAATSLAAVAVAVAAPASAAPADRHVVDTAAAWLAAQLSDAGTVVGSFPGENGEDVTFDDWGRTLDAALALLAVGGQDNTLGRSLHSVAQSGAVAAYTQGAPFDRADAAYAGATAKLAFVVELTGGDPTDTGGVDLLAQLRSLAQPTGRFADRSDFGDFANLYGHAFALLALDRQGAVDPALVQGLFDAQCADGAFPETYEPVEGQACTGQVDATGLVLQALAALDLAGDPRTQGAVQWLTDQQRADGSFPGEAPVNSTGYAVLGLDAVGAPTGTAVAWLAGQQNADGGLGRGAQDDASSDVFATAQALPALAGTTFVQSARDVVRRPAVGSIDPLCVDAPASDFTDTRDSAHARSVDCLASLGIVRGQTAKIYAPARPVTRAQTASLLARLLQHQGRAMPDAPDSRFDDVPADSTHSAEISWLAELGIVHGRTADTFDPVGLVTRAQMAALLVRTYDVLGNPLPAAAAEWSDVPDTSTHAEAIGRATDAGITRGVTTTAFAPAGSVSREQMASFVARTLNLLVVAEGQ